MLMVMTTNSLTSEELSERREPLFQSQGTAGMSVFANLVFRVVKPDKVQLSAKAMARSPPCKQHRRRDAPACVVQNVWWPEDILTTAPTDDSTVERVLTKLVIRQIHLPNSKEKPDDNANPSQQDSKLAL